MNKIRYAAERFEVRSNYWRENNNDGSGWICYLDGVEMLHMLQD